MKRSFAVAVVMAPLLAGACNQPLSPVSPSSARSGNLSIDSASLGASEQSVPFKGTFEGSQTLTVTQPPYASVNGSATGVATQVGQFTVTFPHTVNLVTRTGAGTYTFTAANGDTVTASFTGQATQEGTTVSIVEHATITGGTGRFARATGTFTAYRTFQQTTGATEGSFDGTIAMF